MKDIPVEKLSIPHQQMIREAEAKLVNVIDSPEYWQVFEDLADSLEEVGLHDEARKSYREIIDGQDDQLLLTRCLRKIVSSYISQRNHAKAAAAASDALAVVRLFPLEEQVFVDQYFKILIESGFANYFIYDFAKVESAVQELRKLQHRITDKGLKIGFLHVVSLSLLIRNRWSDMPEEAFTHGELFLHYARESQDLMALSMALCISGFNYLWNHEYDASRRYFLEAVDLLAELHLSPLLMAYNYIALGYRMQGDILMTEHWAKITLERSIATNNQGYLPFSHANLAWVYASRRQWQYAEDYARKSQEYWNSFPLLFCYSFVLMDCQLRNEQWEEAGQTAYKILQPKAKKLPEQITLELGSGISAWIKNDSKTMSRHLLQAIQESKTLGYY